MRRSSAPFPPDLSVRQVPDGPGTLTVEIRRDPRLRSSVRWAMENGTLAIRAPARIAARELDPLVEQIIAKVLQQRARARAQQDSSLQRRARAINARYFDGELSWHTLRWVTNMQQRLGSCTVGGSTDGDIRISARIRHWPDYVVDYVIAHELVHRKHPDHSAAFWAYLARYPHTERARGFIEGIAYAQGEDPDALL